MKKTKKRLIGLLIESAVLAGSLGLFACSGADSSIETESSLIEAGATENLNYQKLTNKEEYCVAGLGSATESDIVISSTYDGLPVTSIADSAFSGCLRLESVTIPSGITSIGYRAFYFCENLTSVTIPDTVTKIMSSAFDRCVSLESVTIPDSVTSIGSTAFFCCTSLTSVIIPDGITVITENMFNGCTSLTNVTFPESLTSIGDNAFEHCNSLLSLTLPSSLEFIGYRAFYNCSNLTSVKVPDSLISIGASAFSDCNRLQFKEYGNAKYLASNTNDYFALIEIGNVNFSSCTFHKDTKIIANGAFSYCENLKSVIIPDSVIAIGVNTFEYCGLTNIVIGNSATSLGKYLFNGCNGLTSIVVPDNITSIGGYTFNDCTNLTSIVMTASVNRIWGYAFNGCTNLTSVYYDGTAGDWEKIKISSGNSQLFSATRYDYIEKEEDVPTDGGNYWHYVDGVPTVWDKE